MRFSCWPMAGRRKRRPTSFCGGTWGGFGCTTLRGSTGGALCASGRWGWSLRTGFAVRGNGSTQRSTHTCFAHVATRENTEDSDENHTARDGAVAGGVRGMSVRRFTNYLIGIGSLDGFDPGDYPEVFYERQYGGDLAEGINSLKVPPCQHERLNEDGICRQCGADKRGIGG